MNAKEIRSFVVDAVWGSLAVAGLVTAAVSLLCG